MTVVSITVPGQSTRKDSYMYINNVVYSHHSWCCDYLLKHKQTL